MKNKEIEQLINELIDLNYKQGRHSGKWDYCEDKETIGDEYLDEMFPFARAYNIPFNYELKANFDKDTWKHYTEKEGIGYAMDELGYRLKNEVQKRIIEKIGEILDEQE